MKETHYRIEHFNSLFNKWSPFNFTKYKTFKEAKAKAKRYKESVDDIEIRFIKITITPL